MNNYRLYFMTTNGKHIESFAPIEAPGDAAAIEVAKLYQGRYPIELWWRTRKVGMFAALATQC